MDFLNRIKGRLLGESAKTATSEPAAGLTDPGRERQNNEDYYLLNPDHRLYVVADGMGGHSAGEVASSLAVEAVNDFFTTELLNGIRGDPNKIQEAMGKALLTANRRVLDHSRTDRAYKGMGCTLVIALIDGETLYHGHVGDARAYLFKDQEIRQLTRDHTTVMDLVEQGQLTMEEAMASPIRGELSQAIGAPFVIKPDCGAEPFQGVDGLLLCTDGLWDMLSDAEIHDILKQRKPAVTACRELVDMANQAGGKDNITVVVVYYEKRAEEKADG